jgi:glycosyltransferase involved in cell wall biosynthesis
MDVSLIIPTYNGAQRLPIVLESISNQTVRPFEIIVVIDGSTDDTLTFLNNQHIITSLKIIFQENSGRSIVRNRGSELATGDLLIFVDDDMSLSSNCIEQHLTHHKRFPNSIASGAQIDPNIPSRSDFQLFKHYISCKWKNNLLKYRGEPLPQYDLHLTAANMSIPRDLFIRLGCFDIRLRDAEDYDLAVRANLQGVSIFYLADCIGFHYDNVSCEKYILRVREYHIAQKVLEKVNPLLYSSGTKYSQSSLTSIKRMFFKFFTYKFIIYLVDFGFFKVLPKTIRYKLYDVVITANGIYFPDLVRLK